MLLKALLAIFVMISKICPSLESLWIWSPEKHLSSSNGYKKSPTSAVPFRVRKRVGKSKLISSENPVIHVVEKLLSKLVFVLQQQNCTGYQKSTFCSKTACQTFGRQKWLIFNKWIFNSKTVLFSQQFLVKSAFLIHFRSKKSKDLKKG